MGGGGGEGGKTNERPGTDYMTSGPMIGLEKNCTRRHRHPGGHGNSITDSVKILHT